MDQEQESGKSVAPSASTWPTVIRELAGLLPEVYQKSLLKAGVRLIHSAANVGTTWLDTKSRDLESQQKARSAMRDALVKVASKEIKGRPDVVDRAVEHFVSSVISKQENREEVVKKSIGFLTDGESSLPPPLTGEPPKEIDDDWLDGLSRHAENASSDRMRVLFGRILAGEIRQPGTYSLFTLDHLAKFRQEDTELVVRIAPYAFADMIVKVPRTQEIFNHGLSMQLTELGLVNPLSLGALTTERMFKLNKDGPFKSRYSAAHIADNLLYCYASDIEREVRMQCSIFTKVGQEILTLVDHTIDNEMLLQVAEEIEGQQAELYIGHIVSRKDGKVAWDRMGRIMRPPTLPTDKKFEVDSQ